jgi:hypothetical protein
MPSMSMYFAWKGSGLKTFRLSKDLAKAFSDTDIPTNMLPTDFKYPFDSFVIECESPLFYSFHPGLKREFPVTCMLYSSSTDMVKYNDAIIGLDGKRYSRPEWDHCLRSFFIAPDGHASVMLTMANHKPINTAFGQDLGPDVMDCMKKGDVNDGYKMCNIFFNTILYINDPTRIASETESICSHKMKVSGEKKRQEYIYLCPPKSYKPLYASSGKTLDIRFIVRGHWRNQACGAGHKDHKRIWVLPYWKGPEMSEIVSKPYIVK